MSLIKYKKKLTKLNNENVKTNCKKYSKHCKTTVSLILYYYNNLPLSQLLIQESTKNFQVVVLIIFSFLSMLQVPAKSKKT